jgi:hypothetical protein
VVSYVIAPQVLNADEFISVTNAIITTVEQEFKSFQLQLKNFFDLGENSLKMTAEKKVLLELHLCARCLSREINIQRIVTEGGWENGK